MASSFARMRSLPHQAKATSSTAFTMTFTAVDRPTTAAMMAAEPDCCPEICPVCSTSGGTNPTPCLKCRAVFYCSVRHRDAHAFQHRAVCEKLRAKRAALDHAQTARVMSAEPIMSRPTTSGLGAERWGIGSESMDSDVATDDEGESSFPVQQSNNHSNLSGAFGAAARHSMHGSNHPHNNSATYTNPHATYSRPATSAGLSAHGGRQQPQYSAPSVVGVARAGLTPHQYGATHNGRTSSGAYQARPLTVGHAPTPPRSGGGSLQIEKGGGGGADEEYVRELGRASWHVLHCMAERFPVIPTRQEQDAAVSFLNGFAMLYPCTKCQRHFQELLRSHPPDTSSRQGFTQWMEFFHDQVNIILGKPTQRL